MKTRSLAALTAAVLILAPAAPVRAAGPLLGLPVIGPLLGNLAATVIKPVGPSVLNPGAVPLTPALAASEASSSTKQQRLALEMKDHHQRGAAMGNCLKQAADQGLGGVEKRQFLAQCVVASRG